MSLASVPSLPARQREKLSGRALALAIVIAIHVALVLILLLPAPPEPLRKREPASFELLPAREAPKARKPAPRAKAAAKASPKAATTPPETPPKVPPTDPPKLFDKLLFDAVDISKLPNVKNEAASTADAAGKDSEAAVGPGSGPGGATLYKAEWQREPTNAELAFYLPKRGVPKGAWGTIACKTIERYRVEDCRLLGESPPGSGLARAIGEAAWQFRVRPPRVDGKPLVGAWVSIRIEFSKEAGEEPAQDAPSDQP